MEAAAAVEMSGLNANLCSDSKLQMWEVEGVEYVRLADSMLCLTVGSYHTQREAGPWARRDLFLTSCHGGRDQLWAMVV